MYYKFKIGDIVKIEKFFEKGIIVGVYFLGLRPVYAVEPYDTKEDRIGLICKETEIELINREESENIIDSIKDFY